MLLANKKKKGLGLGHVLLCVRFIKIVILSQKEHYNLLLPKGKLKYNTHTSLAQMKFWSMENNASSSHIHGKVDSLIKFMVGSIMNTSM